MQAPMDTPFEDDDDTIITPFPGNTQPLTGNDDPYNPAADYVAGVTKAISKKQENKTPKTPREPINVGKIFDGIKSFLSWGRAEPSAAPAPAAPATPVPEKSAMEKMRDQVANFDEDYKDIGERLLGGFSQLIGYVGPFLLMTWVGSELGKFFTPTMDAIPAYGMAFTIEGIIAACTVAMGRAFAEMSSGKANPGRMFAVIFIWLILNSSSAFGLYLVVTNNNSIEQGSIEQFSMAVRVIAVALGDLGCSAVLMFKGRSLQKHIEAIRKKATSISELADAERSTEEADKNAQLRDQQLRTTIKIQEDMSKQIGEAVNMVMSKVMQKMDKMMDENDKNEKGYGRR